MTTEKIYRFKMWSRKKSNNIIFFIPDDSFEIRTIFSRYQLHYTHEPSRRPSPDLTGRRHGPFDR